MSLDDRSRRYSVESSAFASNPPPTACLNCRQARQKCDRQDPCLRCTCHGLECKYPVKSNRGRKRGSTNKPDTVEKLLSRINDSNVRDEVIAAIVKHHLGAASKDKSARLLNGIVKDGDKASVADPSEDDGDEGSSYDGGNAQESLYSPLQILAAAVVAEDKQTRSSESDGQSRDVQFRNATNPNPTSVSLKAPRSSLIDDRLSRYFATRLIDQTDWDVLNSQPQSNRFSLDVANCEPVAAGIIDHNDVVRYSELFFAIRNPFIGFLDPKLHTPTYVRSKSFTLSSVICALGSAVSDRPRDQILHPVLMSLAEENIKWSIASCVKSVEIIQAIIMMTYWAPTSERIADDPYWLRLSHATQLARELGIHHSATVVQKLDALQIMDPEEKERLLRNFQRTWLYVFIADKSFGMTTGRAMSVSHKDIPPNVGGWWRRPTASLLDRMIVGCVQYRVLVLKAFEERRRLPRTRSTIVAWQNEAFQSINNLQDASTEADDLPSSQCLPILNFYMNHGLLAVNAVALRDVIAADGTDASDELATLSQQTMDVAIRLVNLVLFDPVMIDLMLGFHNTQLIMISHAASEIVNAIKRSPLLEDVRRAGDKIRLLATHIETIANGLPPTSAAALYLRLFRSFEAQVDELANSREEYATGEDSNDLFADWWKFVDIDSFDRAGGVDTAFLAMDPQMLDTNWDFNLWG